MVKCKIYRIKSLYGNNLKATIVDPEEYWDLKIYLIAGTSYIENQQPRYTFSLYIRFND
jgi:hypothetical protein